MLEKQTDGLIEHYTSTYDVVLNADDGDADTTELVLDALPYALWTNMAGTGVPVATTRPYMDYSIPVPAIDQATILENTLYTNDAFTDVDVDKHYTYSLGTWTAITEATFLSEEESLRAIHTADVYILYSEDTPGTIVFEGSFKFIKTSIDGSSPYSTDPEGYGWAVVTDTEASAAYALALEAKDLADSKRRVFTIEPFPPYDEGDLWVDNSVSPQVIKVSTLDVPTAGVFNSGDWILADQYAQDFVNNTYTPDSAQLHRQLDGAIEYYFYDTYNAANGVVDLSAATGEPSALGIIDALWNTQELKDTANGNIVYFKDSKNAYWYQASTPAWIVVTDTSIYEALQAASDAQGAADGKVSQFYAWGGVAAPADYIVTVVGGGTDTVYGDDFHYWFDSGTLYRQNPTWGSREQVPTTAGNGTYIATGDVLTVFDPVTGDIRVYSFNGTSWQTTGPTGIISTSKFFIDLENSVNGPAGVAQAVTALELSSVAYTDGEIIGAESNFAYDSTLIVGGVIYESGFGIQSIGSQTGTGAGGLPTFDSVFRVNAEKFILTSPSFPAVEAEFTITATGLLLSLDQTEATRNTVRGAHVQLNAGGYNLGDMVTDNGSSYIAILDVPYNTSIGNATYWQILAIAGVDAVNTRYPTIFKKNDPTITDDTAGNFNDPLSGMEAGWTLSVPEITTNGDKVYSSSRTLTSDGTGQTNWSTPTVYAERVDGVTVPGADGQSVRTVNLYRKNSTTRSAASGTYADPLDGNSSWSYDVPGLTADNDYVSVITRTFVSGAGAVTEDANWSTATRYSERIDGDNAVNSRVPTIYRLNSAAISTTSGDYANPLTGNASWTYAIPSLAADGDIIYASSATFYSDGSGDIDWSTPGVYAERVDGTTVVGPSGQIVRTVNLYRKNSSSYSAASGSFADPRSGNTSWSYAVPAITTNLDTIYVMVKTFTDDGLSPEDTNWAAPTVYAYRDDGADGSNGTNGTNGNDGDPGADGEDGADGQPVLGPGFGAVAAWSNTVASTVTYDAAEEATVLYSGSDQSLGMSYPAFSVEDGGSHTFTVMYKASSASASGLYMRVSEIDIDLPAGKTHVARTNGVSVVEVSIREGSISPSFENQATSTSYEAVTFDYTPTSTAKWASLIILNGNGMVFTTLYVKSVDRTKAGSRGTAVASYSTSTTTAATSVSSATIAGYWNAAVSSAFAAEIDGDTLVFTNTHATLGYTHIYEYNGSTWSPDSVFTVSGNMVVDGTISADHLETGIIIAEDATFSGTLDIDSSGTGSGERMEINDNQILVYDSGGTLRVKLGNLA